MNVISSAVAGHTCKSMYLYANDSKLISISLHPPPPQETKGFYALSWILSFFYKLFYFQWCFNLFLYTPTQGRGRSWSVSLIIVIFLLFLNSLMFIFSPFSLSSTASSLLVSFSWFKGSRLWLLTVTYSSACSLNYCLGLIWSAWFFYTNAVFCPFCLRNFTFSGVNLLFFLYHIFSLTD